MLCIRETPIYYPERTFPYRPPRGGCAGGSGRKGVKTPPGAGRTPGTAEDPNNIGAGGKRGPVALLQKVSPRVPLPAASGGCAGGSGRKGVKTPPGAGRTPGTAEDPNNIGAGGKRGPVALLQKVSPIVINRVFIRPCRRTVRRRDRGARLLPRRPSTGATWSASSRLWAA